MKSAFRGLEIKSCGLKPPEDQADVVFMLLESIRIDEKIVEIGELGDQEVIEVIAKNVVNEMLKVPGELQRPNGIT